MPKTCKTCGQPLPKDDGKSLQERDSERLTREAFKRGEYKNGTFVGPKGSPRRKAVESFDK
jgi:hypothetical protein